MERLSLRRLPARWLDIALLAVLAPALSAGLGGCATPPPPAAGATSEMPNRITVSHTTASHTLHYLAGAEKPAADETKALNVFLAASEAAVGDPIVIERPPSSPGAAIDDKRTSRLVTALARDGLRPTVTKLPSVVTGELRLVIERYVAAAPPCPNWSRAPGNDFDNTMHSDFGCSTATNLAAMVDNPRDLVEGRMMGPAVGDPALAAMHRFRTGKGESASDGNAAGAAPAQSFTVAPAPPATTTQ